MTSPRLALFAQLAVLLIAFASGGCLTQRTVSQGNEVVAEGYIVKPPLAPLVGQ